MRRTFSEYTNAAETYGADTDTDNPYVYDPKTPTKENDMNNPIHATELVELINEKSREHRNPQNRFEYFNLMAQLARHEARHAEVSLMNKHKHKHVHADLMAAYAADAQTTATPWELWEACDTKSHYPDNGRWYALKSDPSWNPSFAYRRKPKQHTVTLNTEQIKEILMACEYPSWENEDFKSGVLALEAALGVQPKTNEQIACDMLGQAHDALEEHSAEICEPNVDHIQKLVLDAMQLLAKGDVK
jgi:hypothetical protein